MLILTPASAADASIVRFLMLKLIGLTNYAGFHYTIVPKLFKPTQKQMPDSIFNELYMYHCNEISSSS